MEKRNLEQHCAIKFCVKLNENATETYEKLKRAYGEHGQSRTRVFRWHKAFLDGRENVEEETRSGRPCTSKTDENVTKVRDLVRPDRRLTVRMISSVLNLNRQTVHEILTFELDMQKICAKLVPKILTNEQKEWYPCCRLKPATRIPLQANHTKTPTHIEPRTIRPM